MSTWKRGRELVVERLNATEVSLDTFFKQLAQTPPVRVPGTAVFMTARPEGAPPILVHHLKHNKVLHQQIVLLTISMLNTPTISEGEPIEVQALGGGFYRVIARFGFMESPDVPIALARAREKGLQLNDDDTTFYLADLTLLANGQIGMSRLARHDLHLPVAQRAPGDEFLQYPGRSRRWKSAFSWKSSPGGARMALPLGGV